MKCLSAANRFLLSPSLAPSLLLYNLDLFPCGEKNRTQANCTFRTYRVQLCRRSNFDVTVFLDEKSELLLFTLPWASSTSKPYREDENIKRSRRKKMCTGDRDPCASLDLVFALRQNRQSPQEPISVSFSLKHWKWKGSTQFYLLPCTPTLRSDFSLVFVVFLMHYPTAMLGCLCVTFRLQNTMCVYQWQDVRLLRDSPGF